MTAPAERIDGLAVRCRDLAASRAFYVDLLGFAVDWESDTMVGLAAPAGEGTLPLLLDQVGSSMPGSPGPYGVVIGVRFDRPGDVDALVAKLRAAGRGVRIDPEDMGHLRIAAVSDPDGHELWLSAPR